MGTTQQDSRRYLKTSLEEAPCTSEAGTPITLTSCQSEQRVYPLACLPAWGAIGPHICLSQEF